MASAEHRGWPPARIVLATANPGKAAELDELLAGVVEVVPRPDHVADVVEDADTLVGNARLKAAAIVAATGEVALADDTGLEVDALHGRPGVHSARYAGEDGDSARNVAKLLGELDGLAAEARTARFRTVLVLLAPDGRELVTEGVVELAAARLAGAAAPLLEEERDPLCLALVAQRSHPFWVYRAMSRPGFSSCDQPIDACQVEAF